MFDFWNCKYDCNTSIKFKKTTVYVAMLAVSLRDWESMYFTMFWKIELVYMRRITFVVLIGFVLNTVVKMINHLDAWITLIVALATDVRAEAKSTLVGIIDVKRSWMLLWDELSWVELSWVLTDKAVSVRRGVRRPLPAYWSAALCRACSCSLATLPSLSVLQPSVQTVSTLLSMTSPAVR